MKHIKKLTAILAALCISSLLLCSCADMGVGGDEEAFKNYFSKVILLSHGGRTERSISSFNAKIAYENSDKIDNVVDFGDYCYIAFEVADGYVLTVDEFAFFARTEDTAGSLELEFYVTDELPTKIENDGGEVYFPDSAVGDNEVYVPETDSATGEPVDRGESERSDGDVFTEDKKYHSDSMSVSSRWGSVLLEFDTPQTVSEGEYIVIRVKNNITAAESQRIRFTINYLMFHFKNVEQN